MPGGPEVLKPGRQIDFNNLGHAPVPQLRVEDGAGEEGDWPRQQAEQTPEHVSQGACAAALAEEEQARV